MAKSPYFPFYPGDWLRNDVSGCSLEAQGLWLRMMIVMHDAQVYGQLILNNEPMSTSFLAKKCGISPRKLVVLLAELDHAGVINRKENGVIYSGRMERDERERQQNRERQKKHYQKPNAEPNGNLTPNLTATSRKPNGKPNGSSSSSSSYKNKKEEGTKVPLSDESDDAVNVIFTYWQSHLNHPQSKLTPERRTKIKARLKEGYKPEQFIQAINGCKNSPHHMGENDQGKVYDDLTLIFRTGSDLERFITYNERKEVSNGTNQKSNGASRPTSADRIAEHIDIINQYPTEAELRDRARAGTSNVGGDQ